MKEDPAGRERPWFSFSLLGAKVGIHLIDVLALKTGFFVVPLPDDFGKFGVDDRTRV